MRMDNSYSGLTRNRMNEFEMGLVGELLRPGDPSYERSRQVFNAMIDRHPALIVRCATPQDVVASVNFARDNDLPLSVKGGGHGIAGNAVCDDGLMIDLSMMKRIVVDETARTANAEAGLTWGAFNDETLEHGLATTGGVISTTGIAGLTLGGGTGWLMGRHGTTCDNLLSAEVVTADGELVTASEAENSDLFWALRGGGGNFGVVISFEYRLHPVGMMFGGLIGWRLDKGKDVLGAFGEIARSAPDELGVIAAMTTFPGVGPVAGVGVCYEGSEKEARKALEPLFNIGTPSISMLKPMTYYQIQTMLDSTAPPGMFNYWKSGYTMELTDHVMDIIINRMSRVPSPRTQVHLWSHHGAITRVAPDATAFPHRGRMFNFHILSVWEHRVDNHHNLDWTREFWSDIKPHLSGGSYVNFLDRPEQHNDDRVRSAYGSNYERLVVIKEEYDPQNLFKMNQNIKPSAYTPS